jgi:hypothetical protein
MAGQPVKEYPIYARPEFILGTFALPLLLFTAAPIISAGIKAITGGK